MPLGSESHRETVPRVNDRTAGTASHSGYKNQHPTQQPLGLVVPSTTHARHH
jgi:hypothetical protein